MFERSATALLSVECMLLRLNNWRSSGYFHNIAASVRTNWKTSGSLREAAATVCSNWKTAPVVFAMQ
jgi:hypothetical protein